MKRNIGPLVISLVVIGTSMGIYAFLPNSAPTTSIIGHAVLPKLNKAELVQSSTVVVLAKVREVRGGKYPSKIREGKEDIISTVTLEVEKYLYNPENITSQTLAVQTLGGSFGGTNMMVEGSPSFKVGDRTIVFLKRDSPDIFTVNGWAQGKYTVGVSGEIGVGEEELAHLHGVFGGSPSLIEIENEIKSAATMSIGSANASVETSLPSKDGNAEAQSVLNAAVVK